MQKRACEVRCPVIANSLESAKVVYCLSFKAGCAQGTQTATAPASAVTKCVSTGGAVSEQFLIRQFNFIGKTGTMHNSFSQLERKLPRFFAGSTEIYEASIKKWRNKAPAGEETLTNTTNDAQSWFRGACALETEFYQNVESAFHSNLSQVQCGVYAQSQRLQNQSEPESEKNNWVSHKRPITKGYGNAVHVLATTTCSVHYCMLWQTTAMGSVTFAVQKEWTLSLLSSTSRGGSSSS